MDGIARAIGKTMTQWGYCPRCGMMMILNQFKEFVCPNHGLLH